MIQNKYHFYRFIFWLGFLSSLWLLSACSAEKTEPIIMRIDRPFIFFLSETGKRARSCSWGG